MNALFTETAAYLRHSGTFPDALGIFHQILSWCLCELVNLYAGDILYPMFCFFLVLFFLPQINPVLLAAGNLLFDIFIELSQLITLPFLLELRSSFLGSIIFGSGFDFFDFFYYILGNVLALRLYFTLIRFIRQR